MSGASESMIARVARVLRAFDAEHSALTLSEIVARTGLPLATTHRILAELTVEGMLDRGHDARYRVGLGLWEIGELADVSAKLRERALPDLLVLYEQTGENVHLAIRREFEAVYVARLIGQRSVPTVIRMGGRHPLHTTGVGKVLLAAAEPEYQAAYLRRPLATPTAFSLSDPERLARDLENTRQRGYSITHQEMSVGSSSVGVPLRDRSGSVFAAVGLVTHVVTAEPQRLVPLLRRAADGIERALRA